MSHDRVLLIAPLQDHDAKAVAVLLALLQDTDPDVRFYAVAALWQIGPGAKRALPVLFQVLRSDQLGQDEDLVRFAAAEALMAIDPQAASAAGVK